MWVQGLNLGGGKLKNPQIILEIVSAWAPAPIRLALRAGEGKGCWTAACPKSPS